MLQPDNPPHPVMTDEGWTPESPICSKGHHCERTYGGLCFKHLTKKQQRDAYVPRSGGDFPPLTSRRKRVRT